MKNETVNPTRAHSLAGKKGGVSSRFRGRKLTAGLKLIVGGHEMVDGPPVNDEDRLKQTADKKIDEAAAEGAPEPPDYLDVNGQSVWYSAIGTLKAVGEYSKHHLYGIEVMAYVYQRLVKKMRAGSDLSHSDMKRFFSSIDMFGLSPRALAIIDELDALRVRRREDQLRQYLRPKGSTNALKETRKPIPEPIARVASDNAFDDVLGRLGKLER